MGGFEQGVRDGVTGRQVWQGFMDWLRPVDREASASQHALNPAGVSTDLVASWTSTDSSTGGTLSGEPAREIFADETAYEIDEDELLDFLAADHDPIPADPVFREQLRDELWALVREGAITRPKDH
jgi:hypothetical protein